MLVEMSWACVEGRQFLFFYLRAFHARSLSTIDLPVVSTFHNVWMSLTPRDLIKTSCCVLIGTMYAWSLNKMRFDGRVQ